MDDFEKYIKENLHHFDDYTVDKEKLWKPIERSLNSSESRITTLWRSPFVKIAAGFAIILGIFSFFNLYTAHGIFTEQKHNVVSQELLDIDTYYGNLIASQVQLVKNTPGLLPEDKEEFLAYIDELDKEYAALKKEMKKNLNNEYILNAIINNYKKRIELIENLLNQINNPKKSEDDEGYIL